MERASPEKSSTRTWLAGLGSIIGAVLASACCIGPILAVTLGIGSLSAAVALDPYRPIFLLATLGFLGAGFYVTYRGDRCDDAEDCSPGDSRKTQKVALWAVTVVALLFAALPYFL